LIDYAAAEGVARITLNRPEKRNALSGRMVALLRETLQRAAGDATVRLVLVRAAGKDFCAGLDLGEVLQTEDSGGAETSARNLADLYLGMRRHPKPIVAEVQGRALGGGAGLATACDLILATESAQFGYPEVNLGFIPAIVTTMLRRAVGERVAFELVVGAEPIGAEQARSVGLINRVYPDSEFESSVDRYVVSLAKKSATAMSMSKSLLYQMDQMSFEAGLEAGVEANTRARQSEDFKRGVERFLRKS